MNLLYCHDGPTEVDKLGNVYPQTFTEDVLSRYYDIAEKMTMFIRTDIIDPKTTENLKANMEKLKVVKSPNLASLKGQLFERKKAKHILKKELKTVDIVIARLPSNNGFLAIDMAKKMNVPYLIELVTCPWDAHWNHSFQGKVVAPFMYLATKKRVKNSEYVVYVTNKFLQKRYPTKGRNVNCSNVALTEFNDTIIENRLERIKNKHDKIIIGTIGRVNIRFKGQHFIIKVLGKLKKQGHINYEYQLVGDGDQSYLKSIADKYNVIDQIKFLGPMQHKEVFDWLETIDLYTQPSRQEGLPRALIEAMSRGLPSFGANTAGIPELLEKEFIFSNTKKNISEICKILKKLDKETQLLQASRNYEESKKYDKKIIDKKRSDFFKEFVKTKET